ncbi:MAG: sensor domain-containing diguanylate cyclase [Pseudomonadota bacterium]
MFNASVSTPDPPGDPSGMMALGQAIGTDALLGLSLLLAVAALALVIGVISARRETRFTARLARDRAIKMSELLRTVRMAESIAELGVWQYDPATGAQFWSNGMRGLFGIEHDEPFVAGDAETLLFANDINLVASVMARRDTVEPYELRYDIHGFDGRARTLCVQACNLPNGKGGVARVVAVLRDVTSQVQRERDLEQSRAVALSEARHARELASTDALTGLANRRRVMGELDQMLLSAREAGKPLALIMFDIDHFKAVNDTYGHPRGDRVLKQVADIALAQAREVDLVGRVGGEEFVWIVPGAGEGLARIIAERLRQAIAKGSGAGPVPPVTASVGFAEMSETDTSLSLFARADDALYAAKHAGRNRVRMAA